MPISVPPATLSYRVANLGDVVFLLSGLKVTETRNILLGDLPVSQVRVPLLLPLNLVQRLIARSTDGQRKCTRNFVDKNLAKRLAEETIGFGTSLFHVFAELKSKLVNFSALILVHSLIPLISKKCRNRRNRRNRTHKPCRLMLLRGSYFFL